MKMLLNLMVLGSVLSPLVLAQEPMPSLEPGLYVCKDGNNASICPQRTRAHVIDWKFDSVSITYTGDCADQGPIFYGCRNTPVCEDWNVRITIQSPTRYYWENLGYDIHCTFEKAE